MKILAFETTDKVAAVALYADGVIYSAKADGTMRHAEATLALAEELLAAHGLTTVDMDAFAADVGPGSFTGIRIGVCLANALAAWHEKPALAVTALDALAYPLRHEERELWAVIDARNGNAYAAGYKNTAIIKPPFACTIDEIRTLAAADSLFVGTGAPFLRQGEQAVLPAVSSVALISAERLKGGDAGLKELSPLYLKATQAERLRKERQK